MAQADMAQRFTDYNDEINAFIFGDWAVMTIADREARALESRLDAARA